MAFCQFFKCWCCHTDIVKRIWDKCLGNNSALANLAKEAAEEITRLHEEVERLKMERDHYQEMDKFHISLFSEKVEQLSASQQENDRLSSLCDKWNSECDEYREENKKVCKELAASQLQVKDLREYIIKNGKPALKDHACKGCLPHDGLLVEGFLCGYHKALSKTYDDSALRNHVSDEMLKMEGVGKIMSVSDYAERYRKGEV